MAEFAEQLNTQNTASILQFLTVLKRQLWRQQFCQRFKTTLKLTLLLITVVQSANLLGYIILNQWLMVFICTPLIISILYSFYDSPTLADCAHAADAMFLTKSLFSTSLELSASLKPACPEFADYTIKQAAQSIKSLDPKSKTCTVNFPWLWLGCTIVAIVVSMQSFSNNAALHSATHIQAQQTEQTPDIATVLHNAMQNIENKAELVSADLSLSNTDHPESLNTPAAHKLPVRYRARQKPQTMPFSTISAQTSEPLATASEQHEVTSSVGGHAAVNHPEKTVSFEPGQKPNALTYISLTNKHAHPGLPGTQPATIEHSEIQQPLPHSHSHQPIKNTDQLFSQHFSIVQLQYARAYFKALQGD